MRKQAAESGIHPAPGVWVRCAPPTAALSGGDRWLGILGLRSFRILLILAIVTVSALVGFGLVFRGRVFWADVATVAALAAALLVVLARPAWFRPLAWAVLVILALDILDGILPRTAGPVTPSHVVMPMLVLYGALLCDLGITAAALVFVIGVTALTWVQHTPLSADDAMMLAHVVLAAGISGLTALAIWTHHRRLMSRLRRQAEELMVELETNRRLTSVISHDIANPLSVLVTTLDLGRLQGGLDCRDIERLGGMAERITSIVESVRVAGAGLGDGPREAVTVERLAEELRELFAERLAAKRQTLALVAGRELAVATAPGVLVNSILANLVSNAVKFSPAGSAIELHAAREGERVRLEVLDRGTGLPPDLLQGGRGGVRDSRPGTEGELGQGRGLDIVALYVAKLGGTLEVSNREGGGAAIAVALPAAPAVGAAAMSPT